MRRVGMVAVLLTACGASNVMDAGAPPVDAAAPIPADVAPSLDVGTGFRAWESIAPTGTRVELVHGPQGGYHVYARIRETGLGSDVNLSFAVRPMGSTMAINDTQPQRRRDRSGLVRAGDGYESSTAELVILTTVRAPSDIVGMRATLEATVQEYPAGRTLTVSREITIVDDEP